MKHNLYVAFIALWFAVCVFMVLYLASNLYYYAS